MMRLSTFALLFGAFSLAACGGGGGGGGSTTTGGGGGGGGVVTPDPEFGENLPAQFDSLSASLNNPVDETDLAQETDLTGTAVMAGNVYLPTDADAVNVIVGDMSGTFLFDSNTLTASATNFNEYETSVDVDQAGDPIIGTEGATLLYSFNGTVSGSGTINRGAGSQGNTTFTVPLTGTLTGTRDFGAAGEAGFSADVNVTGEGAFFQQGTVLLANGVLTSGTIVFDVDGQPTDLIVDVADLDTLILMGE